MLARVCRAGFRVLLLVPTAASLIASCTKDSTTEPAPRPPPPPDISGAWSGSGSDNTGQGTLAFALPLLGAPSNA